VADPAFADVVGQGAMNYSGETVNETSARGLSAVWRGVNLISGTIASLPLITLEQTEGQRKQVSSFLDDPWGPEYGTQFEWTEQILQYGLIHGNIYLYHLYNGAGALAALYPLHPGLVSLSEDWTKWPDGTQVYPGGKRFDIILNDNSVSSLTTREITHIPGPSSDGFKGMSFVQIAKNSLGIALSGDRSAARVFRDGAPYNTLVTPDEDFEPGDAKKIKADLQTNMGGPENAGAFVVINRKLKLTPWSMSLEDAQFLQSRQFQVEEVSRWLGVPPHLLMQTDKQTSWGTGIEEQNRGLARHTLMSWTNRIQQRLTRLIKASNRYAEFDYTAYIKPSPQDETKLMIDEVNSGLLTLNEAREMRNRPPLPGGDIPRTPPGALPPVPAEPEPSTVEVEPSA